MSNKDILAKQNACAENKISCSHCVYWGFNNGKYKTNDKSRCLYAKAPFYTLGYQYCNHFKIK